MDALTVDRIHFAFTATFHYLFSTADDGSRVAYCGPQDRPIAVGFDSVVAFPGDVVLIPEPPGK